MQVREDQITVLPAALSPDGKSLIIWCEHCNKNHWHGAGGGYGHRVAHCFEGPYMHGGYVLRPAQPGEVVRMEKE